jgi:predicted Zn-dependent protease
LTFIDKNFKENEMASIYAIPISKESYHYAINLYSTDKNKAISFFQLSVKLFPISGFYQVDLANALWNFNQKEAATNQLSINCQQYSHAKEQCQGYLSGHQYTNFNQPGNQEYTKYINEKM